MHRDLKVCEVFLFLPIFFLAYNQITDNLASQAASMQLHGIPNDIIHNLNPISILIITPILDRFVYSAGCRSANGCPMTWAPTMSLRQVLATCPRNINHE